jgi:hypothetical protein
MKLKITKPSEDPYHLPAPELGRVKLVYKKFEDVKPADYNPRVISDKAREGLSNSINTFGLVQPIIFNKRTGNVVGGHQRMYDLIAKGAEGSDMVEVDLADSFEKALNITLNNPAISGEFDQDLLQPLLGDMMPEFKVNLCLEELTQELNLDKYESKEIEPRDLKLLTCPKCGHEFNLHEQV